MRRSIALYAAAIVLIAGAASFFRYNVVIGGPGAVYVVDRWTGSVRFCYDEKCTYIPDKEPARLLTDEEFSGTQEERSMTRISVALLALIWVGPAWAGCANYVDGSTDDAAPRAKMCIAGACEDTTLDYSCGNAFGAQWGYKNGLTIDVKVPDTILAFRNGRKIAVGRIKCTEIDEGSCFIRPKL